MTGHDYLKFFIIKGFHLQEDHCQLFEKVKLLLKDCWL
jgi:hypothetical protein